MFCETQEEQTRMEMNIRRKYGGKRYGIYCPQSQIMADMTAKVKFPQEYFQDPVRNSMRIMANEISLNTEPREHLPRGSVMLMMEHLMRERSNTTLFIPSKSFPKTLYESTFNIDDMSLSVPFGGFTYIAFRTGTIIEGVRIKGCFIGKAYEWKMMEELERVKNYVYFNEEIKWHVDKDYVKSVKNNKIYKFIFLASTEEGGTMVYWKNAEHMSDILNNIEEEARGGYPSFFDRKTCNDTDRMVNVQVRLCLAICCYISAFPGAVHMGAPSDFKGEISQYTRTLSPIVHTIGSKKSMHFRSGHFATLRNKRYRHNKDGSPRIIFRSSSIIGANIKAHTLENRT